MSDGSSHSTVPVVQLNMLTSWLDCVQWSHSILHLQRFVETEDNSQQWLMKCFGNLHTVAYSWIISIYRHWCISTWQTNDDMVIWGTRVRLTRSSGNRKDKKKMDKHNSIRPIHSSLWDISPGAYSTILPPSYCNRITSIGYTIFGSTCKILTIQWWLGSVTQNWHVAFGSIESQFSKTGIWSKYSILQNCTEHSCVAL